LPQKRLPTRKIKRVLDSKALGLSQRAISHSCGISQSTVSDYLVAAAAAGVEWPEASQWDERRSSENSIRANPRRSFGANTISRTGSVLSATY